MINMINRISIYIVPIILILYGKGGGVALVCVLKKLVKQRYTALPPLLCTPLFIIIFYIERDGRSCAKNGIATLHSSPHVRMYV